MLSTVDKLLLTSAQQEELERITRAYSEHAAAGNQAGMEEAHRQAEAVRARAGYSGGAAGDRYELLKSANAPSGYTGYEALVDQYAGGGMHTIAAGYEQELAELDRRREELKAKGKQDQAAARSAVWNTQRLAADGLLTRGLENTGISNVITATALNQAAANAYRALLDHQQDLQENDSARISARADALSDAASLQSEIGALLGDAYGSFYEDQADRDHQVLMHQLGLDADLKLQKLKNKAALDEMAKDYYYTLALQQLKRKWELEDQANGR